MSKRRIMRSLTIGEISAVDSPAQKGARKVLMKRDANDPEELIKRGRAVLTTAVDDHTHLVCLEDYDGRPCVSGTTSYHPRDGKGNRDHSHPWVMLEDGSVVIGMVEGHTHEPDVVSKAEFAAKMRARRDESAAAMADGRFPIRNATDLANAVQAFERATDQPAVAQHIKRRAEILKLDANLPTAGALADMLKRAATPQPTGDPTMSDETKAQLEKLQAEHAKLSKRTEAILGLTPEAYAHFAKLDETGRTAFLEKSAEARTAEMAEAVRKLQDTNPVVFKSADGTEYRQNDDPRLVKMARDRDADRAELVKQQRRAEDAEFTKRADQELGTLSGSTETKVAVLRAIEKGERIENEELRKAALAMLKGAAEAVKLSQRWGHRGTGQPGAPDGDDPVAKLDALAKKHATEHKIPYAKAYEQVLDSPEGRELYKQSVPQPTAAAH